MFGQIAAAVAPAVIGGIMGNKAAKYQAGADRYAVDQQMRPFNLKNHSFVTYTAAHKAH